MKAVQDAAAGLSFSAPTEGELEMAELLCNLLPSLEQVRLVTRHRSHHERHPAGPPFTGRHKIIKFETLPRPRRRPAGESRLGSAYFRAAQFAGVPETAVHTLVLPITMRPRWRKRSPRQEGNRGGNCRAGGGNMNLRRRNGVSRSFAIVAPAMARCLFDEVMTGFRVGLTGARECSGSSPTSLRWAK